MTGAGTVKAEVPPAIGLPEPTEKSDRSLERVLRERRSVRDYGTGSLTLAQLSQLLWSAQGITGPRGLRTAPSAGALYPLELYVVAGRVDGIPAGVYKYQPQGHRLTPVTPGDLRATVARAALDQTFIATAAAVVVIAAVLERTTAKYAQRGVRYVHLEAGHAAQNLLLQAQALGLGAVPVGAFHDEALKRGIGLDAREQPLYLVPVGPAR